MRRALLQIARAHPTRASFLPPALLSQTRKMPTIVYGVDFAHVAREWRCKWDTADDKASLAACQKALATKLDAIKAVPGVVSVQRVVCGGCQDFKVIAKLEAAKFADWEAAAFAPEAEFLKEVEAIPGVKKVETQTFTLEDL